MSHNNKRVIVDILDKEYQVSCQPEEKDALMNAAQELDVRMREVRDSGSLVGHDRIAVMVALNLCHELQECKASNPSKAVLDRISSKLEDALKR